MPYLAAIGLIVACYAAHRIGRREQRRMRARNVRLLRAREFAAGLVGNFRQN